METQRMDFEAFEKDWLKRHKGSRIRQPRVSSWGLIGGILVWAIIALGAALVSGAHSVPAILQTIPSIVNSPLREALSLFGFTIFELLIFAGAVYRHGNRYALLALSISMVGALAANIGSSIVAVHQNNGDDLSLAVAVILALIAPLAAFLAGEMVHRLFVAHAEKLDIAFVKYDDQRRELDKLINRDFVKYEKQFTVHEISRNDFMKSGEAEIVHEISRKAPKPRVKIHEIARQIHENGDDDLTTHEMMTKYNVSLGSTSKIREMLKGQTGSSLIQ